MLLDKKRIFAQMTNGCLHFEHTLAVFAYPQTIVRELIYRDTKQFQSLVESDNWFTSAKRVDVMLDVNFSNETNVSDW